MKKRNYLDNEKLYNCFVEWYKEIEKAKAENKKEPPMPEYIVYSIMSIPENLISKSNFNGYTFKEDMISDAIENILKYCRNFDPEKSKNPFAYFTQIAYYAFVRRILKEKQQTQIKYKLLKEKFGEEFFSLEEQNSDDLFNIPFLEILRENYSEKLENSIQKKKKKKRNLKKNKTSLENFFEMEQ